MTRSELDILFDKFVANNNKKAVVILPSSIKNKHGECFDIAVAFTDLLGIPHYPGNPSPFPYTNAHQIYNNFGTFQSQYFDRIKNTSDYIPQKGDIVIWDAGLNGGMGHVAIATGEGNANTFKSFDQNWNPADWIPRVIAHDYDTGPVLGALRLKVTQPSTQPQPPMNNLPSELQHYSDKWKDIAVNKELDVNSAQFTDYRAIDAIIANKVKIASDAKDTAIRSIGLDPSDLQNSFNKKLAEAKQSASPDKYSEVGKLFVDTLKKAQTL
jgi:hypothetical protein